MNYLHDLPPESHELLESILSKKPPTRWPNCGTDNGYKRHHNHGERVCDPCAEAHTQYSLEYARQR